MPNFVSPGVYIVEKDISEYSPTLNSSIVGIVGFASKGPMNKSTLITSAESLVNTFGKPSEALYGQGLEAALEILEATNQVYFIRAADEDSAIEASGLVPFGSCPVVQIAPSGFGVSENLVLKVQVTNEAGVSLFDDPKTFTIPSGTATVATGESSEVPAQYRALRSVIGGSLSLGNVFVGARYVDSVVSRVFIGGSFAGSGTTLSVSAYEADGTTPIDKALFGIDQLTSDVLAATWTTAASSVVASGTTLSLPNVASGIGYSVKCLWPGDSYNLSTNSAGDTVGVSIEVDQFGDKNSNLTVNEGGALAEGYTVSLLNTATWVEGVINTGTTNPVSDLIQGVIASGAAGGVVTEFEFDGITEENWGSSFSSASVFGFVPQGVAGGGSVGSINPIFCKFAESTTNLTGGTNGDSVTDSVNDAALIGDPTADPKTGMQLLDDPSIDISIALVPGVYSQNVQNNLITLAERSQNFLSVISPPEGIGGVQDAIDWTNGQTDTRTAAINSSYTSVYWPHVKAFSVFDGIDRYYDPAIFGARQMVYTDSVSDPWFAPAGFVRGRLTKPTETEVVLTQGDRDALYGGGNIVNPIVNFPKQGITVFGQRTGQRAPTALDRVNVRRLMIVLRKMILASTQTFVFEPNDPITWSRVESVMNPMLDDIKRRRGITDFKVICDSTTNTPVRIDRNEMWCKVLIKPTKTAEIIVFELNITNQGAKLG